MARLLAVGMVLADIGACDGGRDGRESGTATRTATTAASGTTAAAGALPEGYLADALDLIRQNAFYADRVDWPAVRAEARRRAGAAATREETYDAIRWVLAKLGDHHSFLLTPEQARELATGGGLGFGLVALFPERVVVDVEPGGAAARAGVRVGDLVESVDGGPVGGDEIVRLPAPTVGGRPARVMLDLRRGTGGRARHLRVAVAAAEAPTVRPPTARRLSPGLSLLELFAFAGPDPDAERYVEAGHGAIRRVVTRRSCGWVVDLRRNTGGALPPMLLAVGPVLGDGRAVGYRGRDGATSWIVYRDGALWAGDRPDRPPASGPVVRLPRPRPPVAVLTSRLTGSSGEGVAMAFRGRPEARSFGEPTAGVPTGNRGHRLPDGAELHLTEGIGVDRTGRTHETRIRPDQPVPTDWTRYGTLADPVLRAATAWLGTRCAGR